MAEARWDIVCRVVDNYGDVGIAWRLARQLAGDPARAVRLVVDGLDALGRIAHDVDPARPQQVVAGIEIVGRHAIEAPEPSVGDVVVELLGCGLPDAYLDAMEARAVAPIWVDFEHLTAESWTAGFHGRPSPHPSRPLVKYFYYPGFDGRSGGLLVEPGRRDGGSAFAAADRLLSALGVESDPAVPRISMFAYPDAPLAGLLDTLAADRTRRWSMIVPEGVLHEALDAWFGAAGRVRLRGALAVTIVPFVDQDDYDRLLAACDVNFVRGEDSFVRAQLAGAPFVWQAYRQPEDAHLAKLAAFAEVFEAGMPPGARHAQRAFWQAWNDPHGDLARVAPRWLAALPELGAAAAAWGETLVANASLVERLAAFVAARGARGARAPLLK